MNDRQSSDCVSTFEQGHSRYVEVLFTHPKTQRHAESKKINFAEESINLRELLVI